MNNEEVIKELEKKLNTTLSKKERSLSLTAFHLGVIEGITKIERILK